MKVIFEGVGILVVGYALWLGIKLIMTAYISRKTEAKKEEPKGFTLIELLVVIAIIGILSSVVLASIKTAQLEKEKTAGKTEQQIEKEMCAKKAQYLAPGELPAACVKYYSTIN